MHERAIRLSCWPLNLMDESGVILGRCFKLDWMGMMENIDSASVVVVVVVGCIWVLKGGWSWRFDRLRSGVALRTIKYGSRR